MLNVKKIIRATQREDWPCTLCGVLTRGRGYYVPHTPIARLGRPPAGKSRGLVYGLCGAHAEPDGSLSAATTETIEQTLAFRVRRGEFDRAVP